MKQFGGRGIVSETPVPDCAGGGEGEAEYEHVSPE
jgi:hypothetical protein